MALMAGLVRALFGGRAAGAAAVAGGVRDVAEVFVANETRRMELGHAAYIAAQGAHGAEFAQRGAGWFDGFVNGLNRLPRPMLALGTLGLFGFAMADPAAFAARMRGLQEVPEPLWWLLGAVVSFYFGAREAHYLRERREVRGAGGAAVAAGETGAEAPPAPAAPQPLIEAAVSGPNPALAALRG